MELGHTEARELFSAFVDQDLGEPDEERLLQHLDGCDECHEGLERFEDTIAQVRGLPRHEAARFLRAPSAPPRQASRIGASANWRR